MKTHTANTYDLIVESEDKNRTALETVIYVLFILSAVVSILQFLVQAVGSIVLRITRPDLPRPFRMWLYPLPALLASFGFLFILVKRPNPYKEVRYAAVILIVGVIVYLVRAWRNGEWPFGQSAPAVLEGASSN